MTDYVHDRRMKHIHTQGTCKAPVDKESKADKAVEIELILRIVPPSHVEDRIEHHACDKLDGRCYECRSEEQKREIMYEGSEEPDNSVESDAVYGTVRTVQESPVYELLFRNSIVDDLYDPADKAVDIEHYKGIYKRERKESVKNADDMHRSYSLTAFITR